MRKQKRCFNSTYLFILYSFLLSLTPIYKVEAFSIFNKSKKEIELCYLDIENKGGITFQLRKGPESLWLTSKELPIVFSSSDFEAAYSEFNKFQGNVKQSFFTHFKQAMGFQKGCVPFKTFYSTQNNSLKGDKTNCSIDTKIDNKRIAILRNLNNQLLTAKTISNIDTHTLERIELSDRKNIINTTLKKNNVEQSDKDFIISKLLITSSPSEFKELKQVVQKSPNYKNSSNKYPLYNKISAKFTPQEVKHENFAHHIMTKPSTSENLFEEEFYKSTCHNLYVDDQGKVQDVTSDSKLSKSAQFQYCLFIESENYEGDPIYFFHGLTSDASSWVGNRGYYEARSIMRRKGTMPPVISVSFGKIASFGEKSDIKNHTSKTDYFVEKIIPYIESKLPKQPSKRSGIGLSLGGANILHVALTHPDLFDKVISIGPAVADLSPNPDKEEIQKYSKMSGASPFWVAAAAKFSGRSFPDKEYYDEYANILNLAKKVDPSKLSDIRLYVGAHDELGFNDGVSKLDKTLKERGATSKMVITCETIGFPYAGGGHCEIPAKKIADDLKEYIVK